MDETSGLSAFEFFIGTPLFVLGVCALLLAGAVVVVGAQAGWAKLKVALARLFTRQG